MPTTPIHSLVSRERSPMGSHRRTSAQSWSMRTTGGEHRSCDGRATPGSEGSHSYCTRDETQQHSGRRMASPRRSFGSETKFAARDLWSRRVTRHRVRGSRGVPALPRERRTLCSIHPARRLGLRGDRASAIAASYSMSAPSQRHRLVCSRISRLTLAARIAGQPRFAGCGRAGTCSIARPTSSKKRGGLPASIAKWCS